MSQSTYHIGSTNYTPPSFPTHRTFFLSSESPVFEGSGWCNTTIETANGPGTFWVGARMAGVTAFIAWSNIVSERDCSWVRGPDDIQWGTDECVVLVPLCLQERDCIRLPSSGRKSLADFIRGRHSDLRHAWAPQGVTVISHQNGNGSFGRPMH
ncbi:hypothetical protein EDB84DRAFT_1678075 [Lactarius hengduanensis]|nr:hypothetical protein EDB84DRAFT_1678075 [Lactarius hengduanensis]